MKLLCWNINGLATTVKNIEYKYKGGLRDFFASYGADIVCLQESKLPEAKLSKALACVPGYESFWAISQERQGYSGVTTYASTAYSPTDAQADCLGCAPGSDLDREGRVVVTDHGHFVLFNVYVPNAGESLARPRLPFKLRFLEALKAAMDRYRAAGRKVLAVGDFNIAATKKDVYPGLDLDSCYAQEELAGMHEILQDYPDMWRLQHPDADNCFTVWDFKTGARGVNQGVRIDYCLASRDLLPQLVACDILYDLPQMWSDHAPLLLELKDVPPLPPHPPSALSSLKMKRFNDPAQRSIGSFFGKGICAPKKRSAADSDSAANGAAPGQPAAAGNGRAAMGDCDATPPPAKQIKHA